MFKYKETDSATSGNWRSAVLRDGDAKLVSELTNNTENLISSVSSIQYDGPRTNLDAGITLAKQYFTNSTDKSHKYVIILSDGVPNVAIDYDKNYYWEVAQKYDIENKMKDYLEKNPDISFVCWQGEICAPGIQKNPHHLKETHFYAFHFTDSKNGRYDIREAEKIWKSYGIEVVPIVNDNYIMPDDFEEFKLTADGKYDPSACEGDINCRREGFVYYKTTDPTFSFKNVSREYLLNH